MQSYNYVSLPLNTLILNVLCSLKGLSTNQFFFDFLKFLLTKVIYYKNHEYLLFKR